MGFRSPGRPVVRSCGALAASALLIAAAAPAAPAYVPPELPWANCSGATAARKGVIEVQSQPANGAQVTAGQPLVLSAGRAGIPVTFAITATPPPAPVIDGGVVSPNAEGFVSFTSTLATAAPGTAYWTVSFSSSPFPECAGLEPWTVTLPVRSVVVLAQPVPQQQSPPRCTVPRLRGVPLARARRMLHRAGCRLGKVTRRRGARAPVVVSSQSLRAGSSQAPGTAVSVVLAGRHRAGA